MAPGIRPLWVQREKRPGRYLDRDGLYLQITIGKDGGVNKSWLFRYRFNGHLSRNGKPTSREMGLGSLNDFGLAEARERAKAQRQLLADGLDPIEERARKRAATRVESA